MGNLIRKTIITSAVVALALTAGVATTTNAEVTRLSGSNRYLTSDAIVKAGWSTGAETAVLASGLDANTVDALTVAPLAKAKNAPVVLVNPEDSVTAIVAKFTALNAKTVYIANGTGVISMEVEAGLKVAGITTVIRLGGTTRYDTALNIAKTLGSSNSSIVIASGEDGHLVDSLSIAPIAAAKGMPIFLVSSSLDVSATDYINSLKGVKTTYVLGGSSVVSDVAVSTLPGVTRLAGSGRYETNAKVVTNFKADTSLNLNNIFIASGEDANLIDALAGAPLAGSIGAPIIFVHDIINSAIDSLLKSIVTETTKITELGGTGAVTEAADNAINRIQTGEDNTDPKVKVTTVSLNKTSDNLTVGGTDNLVATVNPTGAANKDVTWTSSNQAVATVDSTGKVKAVSAGTATITVTTVDGSKTASCSYNVTSQADVSVRYLEQMQLLSSSRKDVEITSFTSNLNEQYSNGYLMSSHCFADAEMSDQILLDGKYKTMTAVFVPTIDMVNKPKFDKYAQVIIKADGREIYNKVLNSDDDKVLISLDITNVKRLVIYGRVRASNGYNKAETLSAGLGDIKFIIQSGGDDDITVPDVPTDAEVTYLEQMQLLSSSRNQVKISSFTSNLNEQYSNGYLMESVMGKAELSDQILLDGKYKTMMAVFTPTIDMVNKPKFDKYAQIIIKADGIEIYNKVLNSDDFKVQVKLDITNIKRLVIYGVVADSTAYNKSLKLSAGIGDIKFIK